MIGEGVVQATHDAGGLSGQYPAPIGQSFGVVRLILVLLVAIVVADVPSQLIDCFSIPLPTRILGMPLSMAAAVVAAMLMLSARRTHGFAAGLSAWEISALACGVLALLAAMARDKALNVDELYFLLSFAPLWLVMVVTRQYEAIYGEVGSLVSAFIWVTLLVGGMQLALLSLAHIGVYLPWVNVVELQDRNSLGMLLGMALWFRILKGGNSWRYGGPWPWMLVFTLVVMWLNHARGGLVFVVAVSVLACVLHFSRRAWLRMAAPIVLIGAALLVGVFAFPILETTGRFTFFGTGDAALSTQFRTEANWLLLQKMTFSPWLGLGIWEVFSVRAGGYISHTLYVLASATSGVIVLAAILALAIKRMSSCDATSRLIVINTLALLVLNMTFVNDPLPIYGFALAVALHGTHRFRFNKVK